MLKQSLVCVNICCHFENEVGTIAEKERLEISSGVFRYSSVVHPSFYAVQAQGVNQAIQIESYDDRCQVSVTQIKQD